MSRFSALIGESEPCTVTNPALPMGQKLESSSQIGSLVSLTLELKMNIARHFSFTLALSGHLYIQAGDPPSSWRFPFKLEIFFIPTSLELLRDPCIGLFV